MIRHRRSHFLAVAGLMAFLFAGASYVRGSNTTYPEMGPAIPPADVTAKGLNALVDCAIMGLPQPQMGKLAHCKGKPVDFRKLNTGKIKHWRHGNTIDFDGTAFTPHSTPEQIKKCQLCIGLNLTWYCAQSAVIKKDVISHELCHTLQYDTWSIWQMSNADLFNFPNDGQGSEAGENGNEPCPQDDGHKADKATRALIDAFDDLRSKLTEDEAVLAGDCKNGCNPPKEIGDWWLKPVKKKDGTTCPARLCRSDWDACKMKVFDMAAAGKMKQGDAYKKHRNLSMKLCDAKAQMCKDIDALKKAVDAAKKKYCP